MVQIFIINIRHIFRILNLWCCIITWGDNLGSYVTKIKIKNKILLQTDEFAYKHYYRWIYRRLHVAHPRTNLFIPLNKMISNAYQTDSKNISYRSRRLYMEAETLATPFEPVFPVPNIRWRLHSTSYTNIMEPSDRRGFPRFYWKTYLPSSGIKSDRRKLKSLRRSILQTLPPKVADSN